MRKIHVWCMGLVALFLVLGLAKATAASSHGIVSRYGKTGENSSP